MDILQRAVRVSAPRYSDRENVYQRTPYDITGHGSQSWMTDSCADSSLFFIEKTPCHESRRSLFLTGAER